MTNKEKNMQTLINHLKNSGYIFQGSEIYGGLSNTWDYGPLGSILKDNLAKLWKKEFITKEKNNYLLDTKILMNPQVWVTSGHVGNFSDPLIENLNNGKRYRADKLVQEINENLIPEKMTNAEIKQFLEINMPVYENVKTKWSDIKKFNLMFETKQGVVEDNKSLIYLRPETTQGIMINFKNVLRSMRAKLPMGIGQIGKSFRNEVTPGNFIFRTREFEQMELEVFCHPQEAKDIFKFYVNKCFEFVKKLGIKEENLRIREHTKDELAHYSDATSDIEFLFPFGWGELLGIANRTDFDLKAHMQATGESLEYLDPTTDEKYIPYVIEPSMGLDRLLLSIIIDAFEIETLENDETRIILKLANHLAPYKFAVLPLVKKLNEKALSIYNELIDLGISVIYDENGSIGKRYRRQDSIGTPYCLTIDFDTLNDQMVTLRNRDTMKQIRISISDLKNYF
ncbi:glycine--tRNA ligase [Mycoplasma sp. 1018B]|uniref:glycine--tRNA ligase n=1 Tax=Mycoplasma sp. 1018B TaxID=2967302 RepID=UPI00211C80A3|nr:glycine--tRNA ligase [Mycoplasma sp. 1018B]UUM19024.1 glycine--tRNA ligase [Mycoplasma sp. 1018B]